MPTMRLYAETLPGEEQTTSTIWADSIEAADAYFARQWKLCGVDRPNDVLVAELGEMPEFITSHAISYARHVFSRLYEFDIPAGIPCIAAANLSEPGLFWLEPWAGMPEGAESLIGDRENPGYGAVLETSEVSSAL